MCKTENIHALWIGTQLSHVGLLTIKSFLANGFNFHLWLYGSLSNDIPEGVILHDASEIIPQEKVFRYKYKNQFGHGKGSYAGFSDIFRYKLLYEKGGWWTDMDVTCLHKPLIDSEYIFRTHQSLEMVGNIMKVPAKSELMKACFEEASACIDENNKDWHLPIEILIKNVKKLGLTKHIQEFSNPDSWDLIRTYLQTDPEIPSNWSMIHWVNEEWRRNRISGPQVIKDSKLEKLLTRYELDYQVAKGSKKIRLQYRLSRLGFATNKYLGL